MHLFFKSIQTGAVLGAMIIPFFIATRKGSRLPTPLEFKNIVIRYGTRGTIFGLGIGPVFAYKVTYSKDEAGRMDRAYRLRKNQN